MSDMYYWERKAVGDDFLVLEPCDWTEEEWKVLLKLFGCVEAERIVVKDYILKVYGTPTESMRTFWDVNPGKDEILRDIMSDWERLTMKAKMFGLDIRLGINSKNTLELYHHEDYPDLILVDKSVE